MFPWSGFFFSSYFTQSVTSISAPEPCLEKQWNSLETLTALKSQPYSSLPSWQSCLQTIIKCLLVKLFLMFTFHHSEGTLEYISPSLCWNHLLWGFDFCSHFCTGTRMIYTLSALILIYGDLDKLCILFWNKRIKNMYLLYIQLIYLGCLRVISIVKP